MPIPTIFGLAFEGTFLSTQRPPYGILLLVAVDGVNRFTNELRRLQHSCQRVNRIKNNTNLPNRGSARLPPPAWLPQGDLIAAPTASSPNVVPWGFVSPEKMLESVTADRVSRTGDMVDDGRVEKRAEHLNLDSWEFLRVRSFLFGGGREMVVAETMDVCFVFVVIDVRFVAVWERRLPPL